LNPDSFIRFRLYSALIALNGNQKDLLPHQILLTHQIISSRRRKYLIADEVGLGKTIEVGMIIKELLARGEAQKILVICPASLTVNCDIFEGRPFNYKFLS